MKITLYEDVALRSDYSIVFDNQSWFWGTNTPFAQYLKSRNSYEEEIENVYFSNDGSISISWPIYRTLPQGITYMRVIHDNETKYFFINSYEYRNEIIVLNYTLDVWHTYSPDMVIHSGIINRARYIPDGYRKVLPAEYQTNEALTFNGKASDFYLIAEFQVYRLIPATNNSEQYETERYSYTSLISHRSFDRVNSTDADPVIEPSKTINASASFRFTVDQAIEAINNLTGFQGAKPITNYSINSDWGSLGFNTGELGVQKVSGNMALYSSALSPDYKPEEIRYELTQIYAVPYQIFSQSMFHTEYNADVESTITILNTIEITTSSLIDAVFNFSEYQFARIKSQTNTVRYNVPANDKIVGIGLPSLFLPVGYNGIARSVEILSEANAFGFSMSLIGETGISDISNHFAVPIPFTTPSGTERQLAALSRQSAKRQMAAATIGLAVNALGTLSPLGAPIANAVGAGALSYKELHGLPAEQPIGSSLYAAGYGFMDAGGGAAARKVGSSIFSGKGIGLLYQTTALINAKEQLNKPLSSGNATDSNPIALINASLGFNTYTITPINQEEVDYMLARIGYSTWIQSNDYRYSNDKSFLSSKYEPIQFATLQIHGSFPNNISSSLEQILLDGTLISYDPQIYNKL